MYDKNNRKVQKIKLPSSFYLYKTNKSSLSIVIYDNEKEYSISYSHILEDMFRFIAENKVVNVEDLRDKYSNISNIDDVIEKFIKEGIFEISYDNNNNKKRINCLLIGLGTAGSHIFRYISSLDVGSIVLVDYDKVEPSNIYRQDFVTSDIGLYKYEALIKRESKNKNIYYESNQVSSVDQILSISKKYSIDIIIDAADYPTSKYMSDLVYKASQILSIPCILNSGYTSSTITTPIFTFGELPELPEDDKKELLVTGEREKAPYHIIAAATSLVAEQIKCYIDGESIPFLNQRGYFSRRNYQFVKEA